MSLVLDGLGKRVAGEIHIDDINLTLEAGGFTVLLGRTAAGKTTLMRLMAGLERPTSGRIIMDGEDVTGVPVRKRNVAMVYQQFINYPSLTVYENIASPLRIMRLGRGEIDRRVRETAEMMHIEALLQRVPGELSGGQQQRTAMARALVKDARLLLFDEPLVNLDYKLREELRAEMRDIFQRRQAVAVYATTEPVEALTLGGQVAILHEGRLLQSGPMLEAYHHPATLTVSQVFSDPPFNLIDGEIEAAALRLADERLACPMHLRSLARGPYRFAIRPSHLFVERRSDADVTLDGVVDVAEISGSETYIHLQHSAGIWVVQEDGVHRFSVGQTVPVYFDPRRLYAYQQDGRLAATPNITPAQHGPH